MKDNGIFVIIKWYLLFTIVVITQYLITAVAWNRYKGTLERLLGHPHTTLRNHIASRVELTSADTMIRTLRGALKKSARSKQLLCMEALLEHR